MEQEDYGKKFSNWVGDEESIEEEIKRVKGKEDDC